MAKQRRNRHKRSALWGNRSAHRGVRLFRGSIGQSRSALSASSLKNVSAVSSSHSLSEAMLLLSLSLLRLVSSEHYLHLLDVYRKRVALQPFYAFTQ